MANTKRKMIAALDVLKGVCNEITDYYDCSCCPLYQRGYNGQPPICNGKIKEITEEQIQDLYYSI